MQGNIFEYKKPIYEIGLPKDLESTIWDFYVTRSFANSASQKRTVKDFGIKQIPFKKMMQKAEITDDNCKILTCTTMKKALADLKLEVEGKDERGNKTTIEIDFDTPRICCLQSFTVNEDIKVVPSGSQADCILTHIRNSFAHGNTYFFDNGNVLLEDKDRGKVTARMLIAVESLIDWIKLIDSSHIVYPELFKDSDLDSR